MEAIVYKTILSYYFVDNQNYKVGNQWMDGSMDQLDGWMDGWMVQWIDGWMDGSIYALING